VRREKFYAMGKWETSGERRSTDKLARMAIKQDRAFASLREALAEYIAEANRAVAAANGKPMDETALAADRKSRRAVARILYAIERADAQYVSETLGRDAEPLSKTQWAQIHEYVLERRYDHRDGAQSLHPNGGVTPYRRQHPVDWIRWITDEGSFREFAETIRYCSVDQLHFPQYEEALARGIAATGLESGLITGTATIGGHEAVLAANNFGLVGSSLCDEIGEKFRYAAHQALETQTPMVSVSMGGGARMQEGTPSMHRNIPKVQHSLNQLEEAGVPHLSVISDPTLGGTAISYGLRGDYMIVVKGSANIGFSGKRVVEQFQGRKVARDFQHGTWLLHRGFVDERVATEDLGKRIAELLTRAKGGGSLADLQTRRPRRWKPTKQVKLRSPRKTTAKRPTRKKTREVLSA
jgi:acetyl-CoA carboxylase beta subunit